MVGLGLARVPDDEVRPERRRRLPAAHVVDAAEEAVTVAPPAHAPQQRARDVLEREVEVGHARVAYRVDQLVGEVRRVEVEQPHARDPRRDCPHQGDDLPLAGALVASERREVLGDQHDLLHLELVDLGEDRLDRPRPLRPPERRDRAEAALAITALGDLHVGPWSAGPRSRQVEQVELRHPRVQRHRHPEAGDRVGLGQRARKFLAVALGEAPGDDEPGSGTTRAGEREHGLDRLLTRCLDERARVDDHDVGVLGHRRGDETVGRQRARELVGVDLVLGAAKCLYPVGTLDHTVNLPVGPQTYSIGTNGRPSSSSWWRYSAMP